jgi:hypothetical protein
MSKKKSNQKANEFLDSPSEEGLEENAQQQSAGAALALPHSESSDRLPDQATNVGSHVSRGGNGAPAGQNLLPHQSSTSQVEHLAGQVQNESLTYRQVQDSSLVSPGPESTAIGGLGSAGLGEAKSTLQVTLAEYEYLKYLVQQDRDMRRQRQQASGGSMAPESSMDTTIRMDQSPVRSMATPQSSSHQEHLPLAFGEAFSLAFNVNPSPAFISSNKPNHGVITIEDSEDSPEKLDEQTSRSKNPERKALRKTKLKDQSGSSEERKPVAADKGPARPASSSPRPQKGQPPVSKASTPKRPAGPVTAWSCPNCGSKEPGHDAVLCTAPRRTDITRSIAEEQWLKQLDKLRRDQRHVQYQQMREAAESESGSEIHSESEEEDEESESEEEDSSYLDDTSSYQPSSISVSSASSKSHSQERALQERLARLEAILLSGHVTVQPTPSITTQPAALVRRTDSVALTSQHREPSQNRETNASAVRFSTSPRRAFSDSPTRLTQGMLGCPELEKREDLLVLSKFEALEKKYADYVDRAQDHDRTPQTMAHCFRKYLPTIVMTLNSLLSRDAAVRRKFKTIFAPGSAYVVTEDMLREWDAHTFRSMYKELCTAKTFMASEVITQLMETRFSRHPPRGQDPYTLTAFVMQATTAFQEKLESMPTQTVKRCSDSQLRDSFVKMILGKDDRHLADFSHCYTWLEAAQSMFDLEGTGQGVNFMRQALQDHAQPQDPSRAAGGQSQRPDERSGDKNRDRSSDRHTGRQDRSEQGRTSEPKDWSSILQHLSAQVEHNPRDLEGHVSDKEKAKRLLSLRDARKREQELNDLERSLTNGRSAEQHGPQRHGPSRDPSQTRRQGSPVGERQPNRNQEQPKENSNIRVQSSGGGNGGEQRSQSQLGPSESKGPRCYNCHGYGHLAKECPKIGAGSSGSQPPPRSRDSSTASTTRRNA